MQDAINEFTGSSEEAKICIANADLALSRGDSEQALMLLKTITEDKPYYIHAKEKMAQLYFTHRYICTLMDKHSNVLQLEDSVKR